jgi:hypothetical protein
MNYKSSLKLSKEKLWIKVNSHIQWQIIESRYKLNSTTDELVTLGDL